MRIVGEPQKDAEAHVAEDDLGRMLCKVEEVCKTEQKSRDLKRMFKDYTILLYPDRK